jgi:uncharacterized membrane protein
MLRRPILLAVLLLSLLPVSALARAGGGTHSFSAPSGRSRGFGRGFGGGGHHFFFFGGGGGGGGGTFVLLIIIAVIVFIVISRSRGRRS